MASFHCTGWESHLLSQSLGLCICQMGRIVVKVMNTGKSQSPGTGTYQTLTQQWLSFDFPLPALCFQN